MYPMIEQELTRQAEIEARRAAVEGQRLRALEVYGGAKAVPNVDVAIRKAVDGDLPELLRLADLDSRPLPTGDLLVAEAAGRIRVAIQVEGDAVIADPFVPTAELTSLLRLRAQQTRRERRRARTGVLSALHLRPHRAG
jgi:hypothetical protein